MPGFVFVMLPGKSVLPFDTMIFERPSFSSIQTAFLHPGFSSLVLFAFLTCTHVSFANEVTGVLKVWHRITITFEGPETDETAAINPFADFRLGVEFIHEQSGQKLLVPGFYAADGNAAETGARSGNKWRVHFVPHLPGEWSYHASFRSGNFIAVNMTANAGTPVYFDGEEGRFIVESFSTQGNNGKQKGMLNYTGEHFLQYAGSGDYFIKAGSNGPENLLAYADFDGTYDTNCNGDGLDQTIHRYMPHVSDWRPGDPSWRQGMGKGLIGAINYLETVGVNSLYFLTYNIDGGDGCDVWPWIENQHKHRFDVSKLSQWEIVFSHMDTKGIQLHMVLSERQNAKKMRVDGEHGATLNDTRKLYYRELVARFGHHLALQWNLGEENSNNNKQRKQFASYIRSIDPYSHPITVHTSDSKAFEFYDGLLGHPSFEGTSLQADIEDFNALAIHYRELSEASGKRWLVYADEQAPNAGNNRADLLRKEGLWGNLMGGGAGVEWYFSADLSLEDFRKFEPLWNDLLHARNFFEQHLPFWEMEPANDLVLESGDYAFVKRGEILAAYSRNGGESIVDLTGWDGAYDVRWYNPRVGGSLINGEIDRVVGGQIVSLGIPPTNIENDWVVLVGQAFETDDIPPITDGELLYRVNAGGGGVAAPGMKWGRDTKNKPAVYVNAGPGNNKTSKHPFTGTNNSDAPDVIFNKSRWDPDESAEMQWDFPVTADGYYIVNLYFAETSVNNKWPGSRVFDVHIEGNIWLQDLDVAGEAGFMTALKKTIEIAVHDGNLDLDFARRIDHPFINGIEIWSSASTALATPHQLNGIPHAQRAQPHIVNLPGQFHIHGSFPNPANEKISLLIDLPASTDVSVELYDTLGRSVAVEEPSGLSPGYQVAVDVDTWMLNPGVYFYRVNTGG